MCRGRNIIPSFYKLDKKNKETFLEDGWLASGDIGCIMPGSNALKIIDRKKNIFKLAQGEYIIPEKLENIYKNAHSMILEIFLFMVILLKVVLLQLLMLILKMLVN